MSLFIVDTERNLDLLNDIDTKSITNYSEEETLSKKPTPFFPGDIDPGSEEEDDGDYGGLPPPSHDISHLLKKFTEAPPKTKAECDMEYAVNSVKAADAAKAEKKSNKPLKYKNRPNKDLLFHEYDKKTGIISDALSQTNCAEELKASTLDGIEKAKGLPKLHDKTLRNIRRIEAAKTKGEGWFNMGATEVTEEVENDLKILQMRSVLNPKQFYKKNDLKVLPKYFQIGTVQHSPLDYYKERDTKRNKKKTLVDELLADAEFQKFNKRKYKETVAKNDMYARRKAMKKMKKLKKNKK
ncbi:deoxynucleotidyltransferase terminal-interacting protein 2 [Episyrphus balteatus]|uniref:deoxynucleotidyltransferase terminal-interacting protein 2 n=1 Tax=Episyrphus balteatus TaxID=286459 RepID=UPI0024858DA6|nr:deoxynucleotidyltransferase terminal-interacting protein 2 [Episyrphus balteatus]